MDMIQMLSYNIVVLVVIAIAMGWMFWRLHKNRKFAENKIMAWFWPETGHKYYVFLPREDDGRMIKAPMGHSCPRYFLDSRAVGWEKYPDSPPMGMKFLQIDVPTVVWQENNPEPLVPGKLDTVVTSRMIDGIVDEGFVTFAAEQERIIHELEKEVLKAKANAISPTIVYALGAGAMIAAIVSAFLVWQCVGALQNVINIIGA
jgi:hypothetical protein